MKRIIVIGCPGAGKSTLARKLRDTLRLPLFYCDVLFFNSDKTNVSRDEFDKSILNITETNEWIVDGNYLRTMPIRLEKCDTVFFRDYPTELCLENAAKRIGTKREDLPWIENDFDEDFKQYIKDFAKDQLPKIYSLLSQHSDKNIYVFHNPSECDDFVNLYLQSALGNKADK